MDVVVVVVVLVVGLLDAVIVAGFAVAWLWLVFQQLPLCASPLPA